MNTKKFKCRYNSSTILVDQGKNVTLFNFVGFSGNDTVIVNLTDLKLLFEEIGLKISKNCKHENTVGIISHGEYKKCNDCGEILKPY